MGGMPTILPLESTSGVWGRVVLDLCTARKIVSARLRFVDLRFSARNAKTIVMMSTWSVFLGFCEYRAFAVCSSNSRFYSFDCNQVRSFGSIFYLLPAFANIFSLSSANRVAMEQQVPDISGIKSHDRTFYCYEYVPFYAVCKC
jgi:hypothetical protein